MKIKSYKELQVWQKSMKLAVEIYLISQKFPQSELYGLTSQMRRSAFSIPSNIAEGHARALAAIDDPGLMIEAYKIVLRESGSVRRAEELARRMKVKGNQPAKRDEPRIRVVSEEIDKMIEDLKNSFTKGSESLDGRVNVKLVRSQRETKINFAFKGSLVETEDNLQRIYKSLTSN